MVDNAKTKDITATTKNILLPAIPALSLNKIKQEYFHS
jgi:hypothetical protein